MKTKVPFEYIVIGVIVLCLGIPYLYVELDKRKNQAEHRELQIQTAESLAVFMCEKELERTPYSSFEHKQAYRNLRLEKLKIYERTEKRDKPDKAHEIERECDIQRQVILAEN